METVNNFYFHFLNPQIRVALAFALAIVLNAYAIPVILYISRKKNLFDRDAKAEGKQIIPTIGGLGIFASFIIVSLTFVNTCGLNGNVSSLGSLPPIIAGVTLIFFIGMKDDLLDVSYWKKLLVELLALGIIIVVGEVRINSLQGMFTFMELSYAASVLLSIFVGFIIINAFNFIDGIDGLASSIALIGSIVFGFFFIASSEYEYAILAFTLTGSLIPFIYYNINGRKNKLYLGDTGSLLIGLMVTVLVFRFNQLNSSAFYKHFFVAAPAFSFAVVIVPMFDVARVFILRIFNRTIPFKADRRHLHYILVDCGLTHLQSTALLLGINLAFIVFAYYFNFLGNSTLMYIMLAAIFTFSVFVTWLKRRNGLRK
jgi:UDP-N-acetylmuramyl pentapeptide phosphotransferase/UDP-N-acetylglucosamine-1-phosphate transferase